jgi:hypothetical protein
MATPLAIGRRDTTAEGAGKVERIERAASPNAVLNGFTDPGARPHILR